MLEIIKSDSWLAVHNETIEKRYNYINEKKKTLIGSDGKLSEFASGYKHFGLHSTPTYWVIREWAPNANAVFLIGQFSEWEKNEKYKFKKLNHGEWELELPKDTLKHLDLYKLFVEWDGGSGERLPAWTTRVVQDHNTHIFSAQVWFPKDRYVIKYKNFVPNIHPLLIYECHIGMSSEEEKVSTFNEFKENILPRIKELGYNAIQIMGIQEHPYYGSFGYHVSNFFAVSSRFGSPDDLKELIDIAHSMGIAVIMDIVHSHASKNEIEGLGRFDGTTNQFFRGEHPQWDSYIFDYGKNEVLHFLLSNCKFWLEEYNFDGFRFDGVTSMLFYDHGLGKDFTNYNDYYDNSQDIDAITYLTLANELIHDIKPLAITIAEDMSGMPGLAYPIDKGGYGFDYRMALNIPDYWIKLIKEKKDEEWDVTNIFWELTNRRVAEKTISYAESHDQALVGDKTIIFRLMDAEMYWHMSKLVNTTHVIDRGMALHKMIRLMTISTINGGYLTFMGNEFGHPEWIDFPRENNGWSYKHATRRWSLNDNKDLKYHYLSDFDKAMIETIKKEYRFEQTPILKIWDGTTNEQIIIFMRGNLMFVFNFNPTDSFFDYKVLAPQGKYKMILNTDSSKFGGNDIVDSRIHHLTQKEPLYREVKKEWLSLYLPARSAYVLLKED